MNVPLNAYIITMALIAARKLQIFELIESEPRSIVDLAKTLGSPCPEKLLPLMDYLCAHGFFNCADGIYSNRTSSSRFAKLDQLFMLQLDLIAEQYLPAFLKLSESIVSNKTAYELAHGKNIWDDREASPKKGETFQKWLNLETTTLSDELSKDWPWHRYVSLLDIGGGMGALATSIKRCFPTVTVSVLEKREVCQRLEDRQSINADSPSFLPIDKIIIGDFFSQIPCGYDAYLLKSVLHDWSDSDCLRLLGNVEKAMSSKAELIILERVLNEPSVGLDNDISKRLHLYDQSLLMHVLHGSRERTRKQWLTLFVGSGLTLSDEKSLESGFTVFKLTRHH